MYSEYMDTDLATIAASLNSATTIASRPIGGAFPLARRVWASHRLECQAEEARIIACQAIDAAITSPTSCDLYADLAADALQQMDTLLATQACTNHSITGLAATRERYLLIPAL